MALRGLIADSLRRKSIEAEAQIRAMVTENLQAEMASSRMSRRLALSTPSTRQESATQAPPAMEQQILQQMRELVLSTEPWEELPVIPISEEELKDLQIRVPTVRADLTATKPLLELTFMGCSFQLVKPDSQMTASELRKWMLARRQLQQMTVPSISAT